MSLSIEPKHGILLELTRYSPIRSWQGGGKFWEHDHQLTIRQGSLAGFLPRVQEENNSVRYEHMVDGREAASESVPLTRMDEVPAGQIGALRAALQELKAKAEDPLCDDTKRRIIEAFRLPDPVKDPELYRLYGKGQDRRLLVLWGVEKEAGSALVPLQALAGVPQQTRVTAGKGNSLLWLWIFLAVLLLAVLLWWTFHRSGGTRQAFDEIPGKNVSLSETTPRTISPPTPPPLTSAQPGNPPSSSGLVQDAGKNAAPEAAPTIPRASGSPLSSQLIRPDQPVASPSDNGTGGLASPPTESRTLADGASTAQGKASPAAQNGSTSPGPSPTVPATTNKNRSQPPFQPDDPAATRGNQPADPTGDASTSAPAITPAGITAPPPSRITSLEIVSARSGTAPKKRSRRSLVQRPRPRCGRTFARRTQGHCLDHRQRSAKRERRQAGRQLGAPGRPDQGNPSGEPCGHHSDGRPLKAQADVEIDVKVTEESSVKVRSAGQ